MATDDSEEMAAARKEVDAAVKKYTDIFAKEHDRGGIYVASWATYVEFISGDGLSEGYTHSVPIVPDDQSPVTTRGLFEFGCEAFSKGSGRRTM